MSLSISFELSDQDLEHFVAAQRSATAAAGSKGAEEIIAASTRMLEGALKTSVPDFVQQRLAKLDNLIAMLRDEGLCWAARADVHDCFPSIDVSRVPGLLGAFVEDARLLGLVDDLLARCRIGVGGRRAFAGLPQGSPLSPLFANLVLTDEINRTSPRTLSCLLEAMENGRVPVEGRTIDLGRPFLVLATRNPIEFHGTYPVPEASLDRFLVRV